VREAVAGHPSLRQILDPLLTARRVLREQLIILDKRVRDGAWIERLNGVVDFELFRRDLERAVPRSDRSKGDRPAFDHVLMFKVLILRASRSLSDERTEYLIKDRLSFMRFLGLGLANTVPDAIWAFREAPTRARIGVRLTDTAHRNRDITARYRTSPSYR
jgi:hypothetical protein